MMNDKINEKEPSRLRKHLALLGHEDLPEHEIQEEQKIMAGMQLPPLTLGASQPNVVKPIWWRSKPWQTSFALVGVMVLTIVVGRLGWEERAAVNFKGNDAVSIWYQRGQEAEKLGEQEILKTGDKFRVEVTVTRPSTAYLVMLDNLDRNQPLRQEVLDTALQLAAGETKAFADAYELTDPNLNEEVSVVICSQVLTGKTSATRMREIIWQTLQDVDVSGCTCKRRVLR
jgi:hypothetical protein